MDNTLLNIVAWAERNNSPIRSMSDAHILEQDLISCGYFKGKNELDMERLYDVQYEMFLQVQSLRIKQDESQKKHDECIQMLAEVLRQIKPTRSAYKNRQDYLEALGTQQINTKMYGKRGN